MSIDRSNVWRFVKVGQEPRVESVRLAYGRDHHARDRGKSNEDLISSHSILGGLHHQYGHRSTEPGDWVPSKTGTCDGRAEQLLPSS
jgi:hypothetical protein